MKRLAITPSFSPGVKHLLYSLSGLVVALGLAGCGRGFGPPQETPLSAGMGKPAFLMTKLLTGGETIEEVEVASGGRVLVWNPGEYAQIGLDRAPELAADDATTVEMNTEAFNAGGAMAEMNGSSVLWGGGSSVLWGGGSSVLWGGGSSVLWGGGEYLWVPENSAVWQQIGLEQAHRFAPNLGYGVTVAIIDTGADLEHPALIEALAPAADLYDFHDDDRVPQERGSYDDPGYGHGTNVAGIVRQIAPGATILPLRVLGPAGQGDVADVSSAIDWAVSRGADIINLSLGADHHLYSVEAALKSAANAGVFVFTSTGNTGDSKVTFPATATQQGNEGALMVSVTSVDAADNKSEFATYHPRIELAAPGEGITGPAPENRKAAWSGTSMAAPMAAGALALALAENLVGERSELGSELKLFSSDIYADGQNQTYKGKVGEGRLDVAGFLESVVYRDSSEDD